MRENPYDRPDFFDKYSRMDRSRYGLSAAGEWPELEKLLPDFTGKRVLDLGCGYGWHCRYARDHGAASVLGIDLSAKMLAEAEARGAAGITYRRAAMEDAAFPDGSFDVILSSLAFHYVADFRALAAGMARWLAPGGRLVFSAEHPIFTAAGPQDWCYGPDGEKCHFPVDRYFEEGPRAAVFLGETVTKYHRTVTTYLEAMLENGLILRAVVEPQPPAAMLELPGWRDELRRPMMLLVAADKPGP